MDNPPDRPQALPRDPQDYEGVRDGFDCVCQVCRCVFESWTPDLVCGHCDYLNGLEEDE